MAGDRDAVSPVLATILVMTIMITAIMAIMYWGNLTVLNMEANTAHQNAIRTLRDINKAVDDVTSQGLGATRTVDYSVVSGEMNIERNTSLWGASYSYNSTDSVKYYDLGANGFKIENTGPSNTAKLYWTDKPMDDWWDNGTEIWQYRVPVTVKAGAVARDYEIIEANMNFKEILESENAKYGLDPSSIRVVEYTSTGEIVEEVPSETGNIDYATTVLNDPWDMDASGDVITWGGMTNPVFFNSIMSTSTSVDTGWFAPLFNNNQIDPLFYTQLSITMYSSQASAGEDDGLAVMWENDLGQWQQTKPIKVHQGWHTYTLDLSKTPTLGTGVARDGTSCDGITWYNGTIDVLKIFPIEDDGVTIKVDEIYLSKSAGLVRWLVPGLMQPNTEKNFMIYFDTLNNGPKGIDTSWAEYSSGAGCLRHADGGINITFNGNRPVILTVENEETGEMVEADTSDSDRHLSNININDPGTSPAYSDATNVPAFSSTGLKAQLRFDGVSMGSNFFANITYETIKDSPYIFVDYEVWNSNDITLPTPLTPQYLPTMYTARGLERAFYRDLHGNITSIINPGLFVPMYEERWVQMYGSGESNLITHFLETPQSDVNNFTFATQNKVCIYDEQSPAEFALTWGSDGFQGTTSGTESSSGLYSYVINGGSDGWQPDDNVISGMDYFTFSYKKANSGDNFYVRYFSDGNWHEITDAGSFSDPEYDGWLVSYHSDTNWHTVTVNLDNEQNNGVTDEDPRANIWPASPTQGGFMLESSGGGIFFDEIYFQEDSVNENNGVHWNLHKLNWRANEPVSRRVCLQLENAGTHTDYAVRKWNSLYTNWLPVGIKKNMAESVNARIFEITPSTAGESQVTTIRSDLAMKGGVTCVVSHVRGGREDPYSQMHVFMIDSVTYYVNSPQGRIRVMAENGGIFSSSPSDRIIDMPLLNINMGLNTFNLNIVEIQSSDTTSVNNGDYVCSISNDWHYVRTNPSVYNLRILMGSERNKSYYDYMLAYYKSSKKSLYAPTEDAIMPNGSSGDKFRYGIYVRAVDDKDTPEDESSYSFTLAHSKLDLELRSTRM